MGSSESSEYAPEVNALVEKYFKNFDTNHDGYLTKEEMMDFHRKDWGDEFDANFSAIKQSVENDIQQFDENKDQKVSKDEMAKFW